MKRNVPEDRRTPILPNCCNSTNPKASNKHVTISIAKPNIPSYAVKIRYNDNQENQEACLIVSSSLYCAEGSMDAHSHFPLPSVNPSSGN